MLAQQIVAICAEDEIAVDDLFGLVRGAYPFAGLARTQLENVLDMLAGRYPSDEFAELRPRIVWDRTGGTVKGRQGARRLAVTNAGTIPDRGLYGVFQVEGGGRVGELDEEMVYEARQGQTFMLGASTWRIEEITRDRVLVSPAPGVPGAVPFWKGEGVGRPVELGERIGRASREIVALSDAKALERLRDDYHLDPLAAKNLLTFLRDQAATAGGIVPSDRTIVVERFRDEIGDWRLCILTPFGARVHAPWAMALGARLRDALGLEAQSIWSDDGIALHLPEADVPPPVADLLLTPEEIEELVVQEVGQTALFGSRFRENAGRALLIPRRRPGQRTPLWQQRLKAQSLLQVARNYGSFPIVLETYRECLQDVFDLPALKRILHGLQSRELDLVEVETASASPFASSLLFAYVATYMYEDDTPAAERRAQALSLDRDLLRELLGQDELRDLLDPGRAGRRRGTARGRARARPTSCTTSSAVAATCATPKSTSAHAAVLEADRRALRVRIAGEQRLIAAEDAGLFRDALGVMPPGGLPATFLEAVPECARGAAAPLRALARAVHDGRRGRALRPRAGPRRGACSPRSSSRDRLVRGELRPGGVEREWCEPDVLRRLRRASLAALRKEVEPAEQAALGRFLPAWHGIDRRATLQEALVPLQALPLPVSLWESEVLRRRVPGYQPALLDALCATGEVVWVGAGLDRVALYFRSDAPLLGAPAGAPPPEGRGRAGAAAGARAVGGVLARPARCDRTRSGVGAARAVGARLGRRGDERRLGAARGPRGATARRSPTAGRVASRARGLPGRPRRRDVGRSPRAFSRPGRPAGARRAPARAPGHRRARRRPGRGHRGRLRRRLRRAARARDHRRLPARLLRGGPRRGAVRAPRRRRAAARAPEPRRGRCASCSPPQIRRSPTARRSRGPAARAPARRASRARMSSSSAERPRSTSSGAAARSSRCASRTRRGCVPLCSALADWVREGHAKRLAVERFDGRPVAETEAMPLLVEAGFLAGPRRAVLAALTTYLRVAMNAPLHPHEEEIACARSRAVSCDRRAFTSPQVGERAGDDAIVGHVPAGCPPTYTSPGSSSRGSPSAASASSSHTRGSRRGRQSRATR